MGRNCTSWPAGAKWESGYKNVYWKSTWRVYTYLHGQCILELCRRTQLTCIWNNKKRTREINSSNLFSNCDPLHINLHSHWQKLIRRQSKEACYFDHRIHLLEHRTCWKNRVWIWKERENVHPAPPL